MARLLCQVYFDVEIPNDLPEEEIGVFERKIEEKIRLPDEAMDIECIFDLQD